MAPGYGPNQLKGRPRRRACAEVRASQPRCRLCGYLIDLSLPRHPKPHPLSSVVDEWWPRTLGGSPTDPTNLAHLDRTCNAMKGGKPPTPEVLYGVNGKPGLIAKCQAKAAELRATPPPRRRW